MSKSSLFPEHKGGLTMEKKIIPQSMQTRMFDKNSTDTYNNLKILESLE